MSLTTQARRDARTPATAQFLSRVGGFTVPPRGYPDPSPCDLAPIAASRLRGLSCCPDDGTRALVIPNPSHRCHSKHWVLPTFLARSLHAYCPAHPFASHLGRSDRHPAFHTSPHDPERGVMSTSRRSTPFHHHPRINIQHDASLRLWRLAAQTTISTSRAIILSSSFWPGDIDTPAHAWHLDLFRPPMGGPFALGGLALLLSPDFAHGYCSSRFDVDLLLL